MFQGLAAHQRIGPLDHFGGHVTNITLDMFVHRKLAKYGTGPGIYGFYFKTCRLKQGCRKAQERTNFYQMVAGNIAQHLKLLLLMQHSFLVIISIKLGSPLCRMRDIMSHYVFESFNSHSAPKVKTPNI